jgi:hypothetical protein
MRILTISFLLFAFLIAPAAAQTAPDTVVVDKQSDKKSDMPAAAKPAIAPPPVENWAVLDDLKTGLQPTASVVVQRDEQADFVLELVRVQWRINDPIDLWIARPRLTVKAPVVLYLYNYSDASDRFHDVGWCKRATADGFSAVGFVSALAESRFKNRPMRQWFVSELPESLGSSVHDVQLILNYLAARGDMDMDHVGMFGMGSGASIAILAAHVDPRIKTLDLLDPWGDWPDWLEFSPLVPDAERSKYLMPEFLKSVAALDPVAHLPSLNEHNLRLQQALSDPVTPKIAKEHIAAAMPDRSQLVKYANAGDLLKAWKTTGLSGWIKQQLRPQTPKNAGDTPVAVTSTSQFD